MVDLTEDHVRRTNEARPAARGRRSKEPAVGADSSRFPFQATLREEYGEILERRKRRQSRHAQALDDSGVPVDLTGLALSGGGVRSAAFCLGALQAINTTGAMAQIDYLSNVSGGGFIGGAMTATMRKSRQFVFEGRQPETRDAAHAAVAAVSPDMMRDTPAVQYLRNFSNYLIPRRRDWLLDLAVLMRGWMANVLTVSALVLLLAGTAVVVRALASADLARAGGGWIKAFVADERTGGYPVTLALALTTAVILTIWALRRTWADIRKMPPEWRGPGASSVSWLIMVLVACAAIEAQGSVVHALTPGFPALDWFVKALGDHWTGVVAVVGTISSAVTLFSRYLGGVLKSSESDWSWRGYAKAFLAKAALYAAAAVLPFLIYGSFIALVVSAFTADGQKFSAAPDWLVGIFRLEPHWRAAVGAVPVFVVAIAMVAALMTARRRRQFGRFGWFFWLSQAICVALIAVCAQALSGEWTPPPFAPGLLYVMLGLSLWFLTWFLSGNANSIHRLYRDRIGQAFLFDPEALKVDEEGALVPPAKEGADRTNRLLLSRLKEGHGPYPIVNAALNIEGSDWLNIRGRNAEFFTFTPHFVGSDATCYVRSERMEEADPALDLGTALAISGAAFSSSMGRQSIRPLTPTLALLNLRLGYWMDNPRKLGEKRPAFDKSGIYLLAEAMGWLTETSAKIYLTDGGHIENLGLYQLLKRKCRLIIVVDAEQDPGYVCPSLMDTERFARIDLGVRIELPWELIRDHAKDSETEFAKGPVRADFPARGPHAAIGHIYYGGGKRGVLLYVKSSLTGDENDYVLDYKRRYPAFPHESTGDQFFGEEQFEAYRALGFHAMRSVLFGEAPYAVLTGSAPALCSGLASAELVRIQAMLKVTPAAERLAEFN
jgi:hypothetical protein